MKSGGHGGGNDVPSVINGVKRRGRIAKGCAVCRSVSDYTLTRKTGQRRMRDLFVVKIYPRSVELRQERPVM